MWARNLKCWFLLRAHCIDEWVDEGGAGWVHFQGYIKTVISYHSLETKKMKKIMLVYQKNNAIKHVMSFFFK